ncbi:unnamed protein product [Kuraishia capsulata CBS 1993]|uniref:Protein DML1 n=1 Tax=Kuraishia capsulata CBS 1993 TaxID=1382522 RepID=W6MHY0_9ASCO|nr:uncharacterized protein KUCA_T00001403001 [Kuraishia capsulata CBS 1993]CDK25433.1 unnamed protein product [Kuraishia capsulata CBS 1993]
MHEVITVSFSQRSNHLATHLFNSQDGYLDYSRGASKSKVDPEVFFKPNVSADGKSVSYTARSLMWDAKDGFGAMGRHEYSERADDGLDWSERVEVVRAPRIPKNAYQQGLDELQRELPALSINDTRYFTDYARTLYPPTGFNILNRWVLDGKDFGKCISQASEQVKFDEFGVGSEEWKNKGLGTDFMDEEFRHSLESCDLLSGLNVITDVDSAWGGFTSEFMADITDEFLPKTTTFVWGLYEDTQTNLLDSKRAMSRIQTTTELMKTASIYIPISTSGSGFRGVDGSSLWQVSAVQNIVVDSWATLLSQRDNRVSMADVEMGLTMGSHRTLVTDLRLKLSDSATVYNLSPQTLYLKPGKSWLQSTARQRTPHVFSRSVIARSSFPENLKDQVEEFSELSNLCEYGTQMRGVVTYPSETPFQPPSSYPVGLVPPNGEVLTSLDVSDRAKVMLHSMKQIAQKRMKSSAVEEIVDDLETAKQDYEFGWDEGSDSYDE